MSYWNDLLGQARHLLSLEPRRPRQASLRRAVSAAYYALFHYLTAAMGSRWSTGSKALQQRIARSFAHADLKSVCEAVARAATQGWASPRRDISGLFTTPVQSEIEQAADCFVQLQEARHLADYDLGHVWTRFNAARCVQLATDAIGALDRVRGTSNHAAFLAAMAFAKRWDR